MKQQHFTLSQSIDLPHHLVQLDSILIRHWHSKHIFKLWLYFGGHMETICTDDKFRENWKLHWEGARTEGA